MGRAGQAEAAASAGIGDVGRGGEVREAAGARVEDGDGGAEEEAAAARVQGGAGGAVGEAHAPAGERHGFPVYPFPCGVLAPFFCACLWRWKAREGGAERRAREDNGEFELKGCLAPIIIEIHGFCLPIPKSPCLFVLNLDGGLSRYMSLRFRRFGEMPRQSFLF